MNIIINIIKGFNEYDYYVNMYVASVIYLYMCMYHVIIIPTHFILESISFLFPMIEIYSNSKKREKNREKKSMHKIKLKN